MHTVEEFLKSTNIYFEDKGMQFFDFNDKYYHVLILKAPINNYGFWQLNDFMKEYRNRSSSHQIELNFSENTGLYLKYL